MFEKLCDAKRAENRAPETIDRYMRACRDLLEYAKMIGVGDDIRDIDVDFARGFVSWLLHERVSMGACFSHSISQIKEIYKTRGG
ncbi:hypothetical protein DI291_0665 [Bacillus paralicheniformis]|nr:hypothetical protein DI291_0665 [Bacillus paralicheniformis]